jgi:hypothetical protein
MSPFVNHPDELISASVTGDLTDVERRQLSAHLAGCERCRGTLAAFQEQRQLLSGMAQPPIPRDLGARVGAGIERGRFGTPWWRRPGTFLAAAASLATVAAAALLVLFVVHGTKGPDVGRATPTASPSPSVAPSASATATPTGSATPAPIPLGMRAGDLVYLQVTGPFDALKLNVIDNQGEQKVSIADPQGSLFGRVERAALSPDGQRIAFADNPGLKGTWRIFVANLSDGSVEQLAETLPLTFGRRLAWSPDGRYLAFTVAPETDQGSGSDVWLYDRVSDRAAQLTREGNAYFAGWTPVGPGDNEQLWVSLGEADPVSQLAQFPVEGGIPAADPLAGEATTVSGFAPLVSPDGAHVVFWSGTMMADGTSGWVFAKGGMPQLATYTQAPANGAWDGQLLFSDLTIQPGGGAFSSGELAWADDSDTLAFWDGIWNGTPQGDNYPDRSAVYVARVSGGQLSQASAIALGDLASSQGDLTVNDVNLAPDGGQAIVTLAVPLPGDLVAPESYLRVVATGAGAGSPTDVGSGGANPPPWSGPGIVVPRSVAP